LFIVGVDVPDSHIAKIHPSVLCREMFRDSGTAFPRRSSTRTFPPPAPKIRCHRVASYVVASLETDSHSIKGSNHPSRAKNLNKTLAHPHGSIAYLPFVPSDRLKKQFSLISLYFTFRFW
jgi:hypothetical protein